MGIKDKEELKYWLSFDKLIGVGLGSKRIFDLYRHFQSLQTAWHASKEELTASKVLPAIVIDSFLNVRDSINIEEAYQTMLQCDIQAIPYYHELYPKQFLSLKMSPLILYYKGQYDLSFFEHSVGIVGTRECSQYAYDMTLYLAEKLAEHGCSIVTGLARGIDSASIVGGLKHAGAKVVAVVANGVDQIVPFTNKKLYDDILAGGGCILSEYPPTTEPQRGFFPARNRLIAALSECTVVAEAPLESGSLITADYAYELDRPVFAMAGHAFNQKNEGNHQWLKSGKAKLLTDLADVLTCLKMQVKQTSLFPEGIADMQALRHVPKGSQVRKSQALATLEAPPKLVKTLEELLANITDEPSQLIIRLLHENNGQLTFDNLIEKSKLDISKVNSVLLKLKLKKLIEQKDNHISL